MKLNSTLRAIRQAESPASSALVASWLLLYHYDTSHWKKKNVFLTWWPWPLTYDLDLDLRTWPRYPSAWPCQNSGLYVCPFTCESETHRQKNLNSKHKIYFEWHMSEKLNNNLIHLDRHLPTLILTFNLFLNQIAFSALGNAGPPIPYLSVKFSIIWNMITNV